MRRANGYGGSKPIVPVTPKPRCSVTAAIAGISSIGSPTGICMALRSAASGLPWYTS